MSTTSSPTARFGRGANISSRSDSLHGRRAALAGLLLGLMLAGSLMFQSTVAWACSTPVYQYAMYNWPPAPYYVFFFHEGPISEQDQNLHQLAEKLATDGRAVANLALYPVDLGKPEQYERLPETVRKSWEKYRAEQEEKGQPVKSGYAVYTAWGAELLIGQLDEATLKALVDSPARTSLGQLFQQGNAVVVLFMPGADQEENQRVEKLVQSMIDEVATGKLMGMAIYTPLEAYSMYEPTVDQSEPAEATESSEPQGAGIKVGLLRVARDDPQETWLLRALMAMDPELEKMRDKPMVFFCYGRGRAMPPYVGEGITAENLAAEMEFLSGACSCMVKDANPGVDLLIRWDWDATAEAIALAYDPQFRAGYDFGYQEMPGAPGAESQPEMESQVATTETIPEQTEAAGSQIAEQQTALAPTVTAAEHEQPEATAQVSPAQSGDVTSQPAEPKSVAFVSSRPRTPPDAAILAEPAMSEPASVSVPAVAGSQPESPTTSFVGRQMWILAAALAGALLLMLGLGRFAIGR